MILGLHGPNAVPEIKRRAAAVRLNASGTIPPSSIPHLARILHLRVTNMVNPPQLLNVTNLSRVMRSSCAAAFGQYNYPGVSRSTQHVLLFYRISGPDNDPTIYLIDPYTGQRFHYTSSEINENLGAVDYFLSR
jgi:hypothetical protein